MTEEITTNYLYLDFPFISKSGMLAYIKCRYYFYLLHIQKEDIQPTRIMTEGTNLHYVYFKFFELINYDTLWDMDYLTNHDTQYSLVYNYFYSILNEFIGIENMIGNIRFNARSFCRFEENHWFEIRIKYPNRRDTERYFKPGIREREKFDFNREHMMFGTIDRVSFEEGKTIIIDYKTGRVPKGILEENRKDNYSHKIDSNRTREGNFYVILYLLHTGFKLKRDEEGIWSFYRNDVKINCLETVDFMFLYTNGGNSSYPQYFAARKKPTVKSVNSIMNLLDEIRNNKDWSRSANLYVCKDCTLYMKHCKDYCKDVMHFEISGNIRSGEESEDESSFESSGSSDGTKPVEQVN